MWTYFQTKMLAYAHIYKDQAFIPGTSGEYPEALETRRTTKSGLEIILRPVKINDESLLKDFFYSLSEASVYSRFVSMRRDMPHEWLQDFVIIDYTKNMEILAVVVEEGKKEKETIVGLGQYNIIEDAHTAEVAFVVRDGYHNNGIGAELLSYLTYLAKKQGLLGFVAEVLGHNVSVFHLFEKMDFEIEKSLDDGVYELKTTFT